MQLSFSTVFQIYRVRLDGSGLGKREKNIMVSTSPDEDDHTGVEILRDK